MVEPTGYTALDLIGFTDKGPYDPTANYVRNDLVHVGNSTWRCKIDDTTGITPTEGANWTIFIESATSLAGMSDVELNTPKAGDGLVHNGNDWTNIPIMTKDQWKKNGAYNLAYHNLTTQSLNGVTVTVNADKSITLNNTATAATSIHLFQTASASAVGLKEGETYKLVGLTPTTPECYLKVNIVYNSQNHVAEDSGNGATFTFTGTSYGDFYYDFYLVIPNGTEFNNDTIYPMITTDLNATYADYVPHAMTNRQLTEKVDELYGSTNNKTSYIRGYYQYSNTISNILTLIQNFLTDISITNNIGVIDAVIAGNTPWSVRGYCYSTKDFAVLTAMRYDGSCKLFYRSSSVDTIKDFTTT